VIGNRAVIVHAHPNEASFSRELRDRVEAGLASNGWQTDIIDLYARLAHDDDVTDGADLGLVQSAHALVFVYPTWWWGMPAAMKGWLDTTLVEGETKLAHLEHLVGVTTYGSRRVEMAILGDAGRRTIHRTLWLSASPRRTRRTWLGLHRMDVATEADRLVFADKVHDTMAEL
jgi:NAD(P)H dehydrogenase (quinone)